MWAVSDCASWAASGEAEAIHIRNNPRTTLAPRQTPTAR
jgi:hypothetical protein